MTHDHYFGPLRGELRLVPVGSPALVVAGRVRNAQTWLCPE